LSKSSLNSTAAATAAAAAASSTPRTIQALRTATVKFDYDASDHHELSVLAKEV
ncbi:unnamed protein product, partial [Rotaria socialis]